MREPIRLAVWLLCVFAVPGVSRAQGPEASWLQWGGPDRNFRVESASLATAWPEEGPRPIWSRPLGEGYSAIVVEGDSLYTMHREGDDEVIVALNVDTGETRWRHAYPAPFPNNQSFDYWRSMSGPGPYSTPLIMGTRLFAVGVNGQLHALDTESGDVLWSHHLVEEFDIAGFMGYASSPIAHGANVILPVGAPGRGVAAFDRDTGEVAWQKQDLMLAPASPVLIDVDGQEQLVVFGRKQLAGLDPGNGALLWSHPHETEYGLNISTPVWGDGNLLFCSSAYNGGSRVIRLRQVDGTTTVEELWFNNRMRVHFGNALRVGDLVLGTSGDFGPAFFTALDIETGEEVWRERSFARSHMVSAGGKIVIVDEDGEIAVATPTDEGLEVHARAGVLKENAWTPPTLVGSRLYVRDRANIRALELGE
jgi:outer membrane protein assembly factor BamB